MTRAPRSDKKLRIPPRTSLLRQPLLTDRLVIEPMTTTCARKLFIAVEEARETLSPWLPWVPFNDSLDASRRYTEACEHDWDTGAALRFYLRLKNAPELVGAVTLENCVALHRSCDLGYWLHPRYTGRGLMTEAAECVVTYAFQEVGFHRIRCAAGVDNQPSRAVIERLGFSFEGVARDAERVAGRWVSHAVYGRLAGEAPKTTPGGGSKTTPGGG